MDKSTESVVRRFMEAWSRWQAEELAGFFTEDAAWADGHSAPCIGIDAIKSRLEAIGRLLPGPTVDVKNLLANSGTVMVERIDIVQFKGKTFNVEVTGVFDLDNDGRITRWRDYYDSRTLEESILALGR